MTPHLLVPPRSDAKALALAFKKKQFKHPKLDTVMDQLRDIDQPSHRECIYVLTGPTGAGKSTALDSYVSYLHGIYGKEMEADPSFMPYVLVRLASPLDGHFNWKDTFVRLLSFFNEVLIERKVVHASETSIKGSPTSYLRLLVKDELRRALESCVRHRRTKVIILDEASCLLLAARGITMEVQFETIKSLAVNLEVPIVLAGAYNLLGILDCNGQLIRRTSVIHFPPYTDEDFAEGGEGQGFRNFVYSLMRAMPVNMDEKLHEDTPYFFLGSLGCAGLLKDWLHRALEATLKTEDRTLTRQILDRTAYSKRALIKFACEMRTGRQWLTDFTLEDLMKILKGEPSDAEIPEEPKPAARPPLKNLPKRPAGKPKKRICLRKPARDKVGGIA